MFPLDYYRTLIQEFVAAGNGTEIICDYSNGDYYELYDICYSYNATCSSFIPKLPTFEFKIDSIIYTLPPQTYVENYNSTACAILISY